jgi:hypothetical protein
MEMVAWGGIGRRFCLPFGTIWDNTLAWLPVETVIKDRQSEYYQVLGETTQAGDDSVFVEFVLTAILESIKESIKSDQDNDQVSDQVKELLFAIGNKSLSAAQIMEQLGLSHRTNFRRNYLQPAIDANLIELTIPDKPKSANQKYRRKK